PPPPDGGGGSGGDPALPPRDDGGDGGGDGEDIQEAYIAAFEGEERAEYTAESATMWCPVCAKNLPLGSFSKGQRRQGENGEMVKFCKQCNPHQPREEINVKTRSSLQAEFDAAVSGPPFTADNQAAMNELARELGRAKQVAAFIHMWDRLKAAKCLDPATVEASKRLHGPKKAKLGKRQLKVPKAAGPTLAPARRLHKIVKGGQMSMRSNKALEVWDEALNALRLHRTDRGGKAFFKGGPLKGSQKDSLIGWLRKKLGVDKDTARGLTTKLQQTTLGKEVIYQSR
ncbi:hypothetical protein TeGR_g5904, partial [Tetraparma gracilis]